MSSTEPTAMLATNFTDPNTNEIIYYTYEMPDFSSLTRCEQTKKLLDSAKRAFEATNQQTKALYNRQIEIAKHYQSEMCKLKDIIRSTASASASEEENRLRPEIELLRTENTRLTLSATNREQRIITLEKSIKDKQEEWDRTNSESSRAASRLQQLMDDKQEEYNQTSSDALEKIQKLTQILNERQQELSDAITAEQEMREEMQKTRAEMKDTEEKAAQSIEALNQATKQIEILQAQIKNAAHSNVSQANSVKERIDAAFKDAMNRFKRTPKDSEIQSITESEFSAPSKSKSTTIKVKMNATIPYFHGRPENNIGEWLYAAERILDMANYTGKEKVDIASTYLRDLAQQDYFFARTNKRTQAHVGRIQRVHATNLHCTKSQSNNKSKN